MTDLPRWSRAPVADVGRARLVPVADLRKLYRLLLLSLAVQACAVALQLWNLIHG